MNKSSSSSDSREMSWFYRMWFALGKFIKMPFSFIFKIFTLPFNAGGLFQAETIENFPSEFENNYSESHPQFFSGSFKDALAAAKSSYKLLLVYLHAPDHNTTPEFCQNILGSTDIAEYISENFVFWACSIKDVEGYRLCSDLEVTTYPFLAVFAPVHSKPTFLSRIEGLMSPDRFERRLEEIVENGSPLMIAAKAEDEEQQLRRAQMEEQERAYNEALERDQERERQRQQEEEERRQAELEQQRREEEHQRKLKEREEEIQRKRESLPLEPEASEKGTAKVKFRLPNGTQLERRFLADDKVSILYDFVDSQDTETWNRDLLATLRLETNFPKKVLSPDETVSEAGLRPRANIFVYAVEP
eukprot:gb/GECH01007391.1/.p1 GENE.gb/GECH01007391.1/~~gb/GECH01007391.1/.p1  ORF type:complete len:360 (+),score=130.41 gb/GECH01007391.1/:1-1080(+)